MDSTILNILKKNNPDTTFGGIWLPYIQRSFVWREEQIESLFDSIMRKYTIGSLLLWVNKEEIRYREFIKDFHKNNTDDFRSTLVNNNKIKEMVLDG